MPCGWHHCKVGRARHCRAVTFPSTPLCMPQMCAKFLDTIIRWLINTYQIVHKNKYSLRPLLLVTDLVQLFTKLATCNMDWREYQVFTYNNKILCRQLASFQYIQIIGSFRKQLLVPSFLLSLLTDYLDTITGFFDTITGLFRHNHQILATQNNQIINQTNLLTR
jgi:hypothetical protein